MDCDDGDLCTTDSCSMDQGCVHYTVECDDFDLCTIDFCVPEVGCNKAPVECDDANPNTDDYCLPAEGCIHEWCDCPEPNPECDDQNACTWDYLDSVSLECYHLPVGCNDSNPETLDGCDPASGCTNELPPCSDGDPCTLDIIYPDGSCSAVPKTCNDGNACTVDECLLPTGACVHWEPCIAESKCTVAECNSETGECSHSPISVDDGDACSIDSCDPDVGVLNIPKNCAPETPNACFNYYCEKETGDCKSEPVECDDGNTCTLDFCTPESGCYSLSIVPPDDEDPCTTDICVPGQGFTHLPKCDDDDGCTVDLCETEDGICFYYGIDCYDGLKCTVDKCDSEDGCYFVEKTCSGASPCQEAFCDESTGKCETEPKNCDDGNPCTNDWCQPNAGCVYNPVPLDGEPCTAGPCSDANVCQGGLCPSEPWVCVEQCDNGVDDDGDGAADCDDPDCAQLCVPATSQQLCLATAEQTVDGQPDCEDQSCACAEACLYGLTEETECGDYTDDDLDGDVDCQDSDCTGSPFCPALAGDQCGVAVPINSGLPVTPLHNGQVFALAGTTTGASDNFLSPCSEGPGGAPDLVYRLDLADNMNVTVTHRMESDTESSVVYLLDKGCSAEQAVQCGNGTPGQPSVFTTKLPPGIYFLVVEGHSDYAGPYQVDLAVSVPPDAEWDCANGEDDDADGKVDCVDINCQQYELCWGKNVGGQCSSAIVLGPGPPLTVEMTENEFIVHGSSVGGWSDLEITCNGDATDGPEVVYKLHLAEALVVELDLDFSWNGSTKYDPALYILQEGCDDTSPMHCAPGSAEETGNALLTVPLPAGSYFVVADSIGAPIDFYNLSVKVHPVPSDEFKCSDGIDDDLDGLVDCDDDDCGLMAECLDPYEPNNFFASATSLDEIGEAGITVPGKTLIFPDSDDDFFTFTVPAPGFLVITAAPDPFLAIKLKLYDESHSSVASTYGWQFGANKTIDTPILGTGPYFLRLSGKPPGVGFYSLWLEWTPPTESETDCSDDVDEDLDGKPDCSDEDCDGSPWCGGGDTCEVANLVNEGQPLGDADDGLKLEYDGTTKGYAKNYSCSCANSCQANADAAWRFELEQAMNVHISLEFADSDWSAVQLFKDSCTGAGLACNSSYAGPAETKALLEAGVYYAVVDNIQFQPHSGPYNLQFEFFALLDSEVSCDNGFDDDGDGMVDCEDEACTTSDVCKGESCENPLHVADGVPITLGYQGSWVQQSGNTAGMSNLYQGNCVTTSGADAVWAMTVADQVSADILLSFNGPDDPTLYLFKGQCQPENEIGCHATSWGNAALIGVDLTPGQYYIIVDGYSEDDMGPYDLKLTFYPP